MTDFTFFWGHDRRRLGDKAVFSQWYPSPFHADGITFNTAEHFMMYHKALLFDDMEVAGKILASPYPGPVKDLGRRVKDFDDREWDAYKLGIVRLGNILKFSQSLELEQILLGTGSTIIVEASPYDRVWGIGMKESHKFSSVPANWKGENLLGFVLMDVRNLLQGRTPTKLEDIT